MGVIELWLYVGGGCGGRSSQTSFMQPNRHPRTQKKGEGEGRGGGCREFGPKSQNVHDEIFDRGAVFLFADEITTLMRLRCCIFFGRPSRKNSFSSQSLISCLNMADRDGVFDSSKIGGEWVHDHISL